MRAVFVVIRAGGAVAIVAALVVQLVNNFAYWEQIGITDFSSLPVNFFSYFTVDSNVLTVVVFAIGAVLLIRGGGPDPRWFGILRGTVTAYMVVVGVVYNLLLRGVDVPLNLVVPWTNEVLHVIAPILLAADWLLAPGRIRLPWSTMWWVVGFPIVWSVYTMIRGPLAYNELLQQPTWYPYPFLNPANGGYGVVALYVLLIAAIFGVAGAAVILVARRLQNFPLPAAGADAD